MAISPLLEPPQKLVAKLQQAWQQQLIHSISIIPPISSTSLGNMNTTLIIVNFIYTTPTNVKNELLAHIQASYDIVGSSISPDGDTLYKTYE